MNCNYCIFRKIPANSNPCNTCCRYNEKTNRFVFHNFVAAGAERPPCHHSYNKYRQITNNCAKPSTNR